jgi:NAD(P)-dependent dehydrogenase (short-subunit alcohol dehydrogenase family)
LPIEIPEIGCAAIDVSLPGDREEMARLADALIDEALAPAADPVVAWRGGERWVEDFTPIRLEAADPARPLLAERAVCLITGGLTGVGLALARELAQRSRARLVLTGRTALPAPAEWDGWLADHDDSDPVWQRLQALRELEALGSEVLPIAVDVTDEAGMRLAVDLARERFGPIAAVVHAAGVPGGGVIQMRSAEAADRVLAPKVRGTRALAAALGAEPLEWMVLCSSTLALLGGFGQIDYCAANSFLDAYARQAARGGARVVSLAWSGWQEVGMAAVARPRGGNAVHPLLGHRLAPAEGRGYSNVLSPARHWILADHRFLGTPTMPGTAYLEMARAAFQHDTGARAVEIRDAVFVSPLLIADGSSREVRVLLDGGAEETTFRIVSRRRDGESWQEHSRGALGHLAADARPAPVDLAAVSARCGPAASAAPALRAGAVQWGPHWGCLKGIELGDGEGLLHLELPPELAGDGEGLDLHPALLDVATAGSSALAGGISLVARSHGRLRAFAPLAGRLVVHTRRLATSTPEAHAFDVTVCDAAGTVQVDVERFVMIEASEGKAAGLPTAPHGVDQRSMGAENPAAGAAAGAWMRPEEAVEAFRRALSHGRFAHLAVSPIDLPASIAAAKRMSREVAAAPSRRFPRPEIETAYAAPTGLVEETLAGIWQSVLGLDRVGVDDNFFDIGGDSVVAIQVVALAGHRGLQIAPELLFERQTIRTLAASLAQEAAPADSSLTASLPPPEPAGGDFALDDLSDLGLSEESVDKLLAKIRDRS